MDRTEEIFSAVLSMLYIKPTPETEYGCCCD